MSRNIEPALLFRTLFEGDDFPELNVPMKCLPTSSGYPWAELVNHYGFDILRDMFEHGNFVSSEASYDAEVKFQRWCGSKDFAWTFVSRDY